MTKASHSEDKASKRPTTPPRASPPQAPWWRWRCYPRNPPSPMTKPPR